MYIEYVELTLKVCIMRSIVPRRRNEKKKEVSP